MEMIVLKKIIVIMVLIMALPILLLSCSADDTPEAVTATPTSHETGDEMKAVLFQSCWEDDNGVKFVDPIAFIKALRIAS